LTKTLTDISKNNTVFGICCSVYDEIYQECFSVHVNVTYVQDFLTQIVCKLKKCVHCCRFVLNILLVNIIN